MSGFHRQPAVSSRRTPSPQDAGSISNPFATTFVSPANFPFLESESGQVQTACRKLIAYRGIGQIVGEHGTGKSTLTYAIERDLEQQHDSVPHHRFCRLTIRKRASNARCSKLFPGPFSKLFPKLHWQRPCRCHDPDVGQTRESLGSSSFNYGNSQPGSALVIDGVEQLNLLNRVAVIRFARQRHRYLLLTTHRPITGVPIIARTRTSLSLLRQIVNQLQSQAATQLDESDIRRAFNRVQGNVREALMLLYDDFENQRIMNG